MALYQGENPILYIGSNNSVLYIKQTLTDEQKTQARNNIGALSSDTVFAQTVVYQAIIGTSWSGSEPCTQNISVPGILESDTPIVDIDLSAVDYSNKDAVIEAYSKIYRITTAANSITIYADEATTTAVSIQLKVVR